MISLLIEPFFLLRFFCLQAHGFHRIGLLGKGCTTGKAIRFLGITTLLIIVVG